MKKLVGFRIALVIAGWFIGIATIKAQQTNISVQDRILDSLHKQLPKDTSALGRILDSIYKHRPVTKHWSYSDSFIVPFENGIYNTYYDYHFWDKGVTHQFTLLQILIDKRGRVKRIWYSDSADKIFADAFSKESKSPDNIAVLEKYAKAKKYKNISILIPVYFETRFENHPSFEHNYNFLESIMKFGGKPFTGESVILEPVIIRVLAEHNS